MSGTGIRSNPNTDHGSVFGGSLYSRISVKNAVFLNIQKSWVKIQNFPEKNTVFALITYPSVRKKKTAPKAKTGTYTRQGSSLLLFLFLLPSD
jgi:hypothetical protein